MVSSRPSSSAERPASLPSAGTWSSLHVGPLSASILIVGSVLSLAAYAFVEGRFRDRQAAAFQAEAMPLVAGLRSAFELPLEVLESTAALFDASTDVTRAEFARFVK